MSENITESIEERPELNLDIRRLWCGVIDNAIKDAKGRKLSIVGTKAYRLRETKLTKQEALRFLKSSELDLICDLFLSGIHADTIRKGLVRPLELLEEPEEKFEPLTEVEIIEILTELEVLLVVLNEENAS